jgi:hypothetical protein
MDTAGNQIPFVKPIGIFILTLTTAVSEYPASAADPAPALASTPETPVKAPLGVKMLGMTLVDPTPQDVKQYQLDSALPMIVQVEDPAFFPRGTAPTKGCAFWIVEPPANGFLFNQQNNAGRRFPKTVRELVEAILACTATPAEYHKLFERTVQAARQHAETLKEQPDERERWVRIANSKIPPEEAGKYICRVVYNYPGQRGTMTTSIIMAKDDLHKLRALLRK